MPKRAKERPVGPCNVGEAVEALGARWKGDILWHLKDGPKRFMELRRLIPSISPKVLTQALRSLEQDGLVNRVHHAEIPPRVEYSMTALGRSAGPVLQVIAEWWKRHGEAVRNSASRN
jgi:DNA-binding HxlR family transcriptional regulator